MSTTVRHRNRTGLRVNHTSTTGHKSVLSLVCACPQTVVAGTTWSWDGTLGWYDPADHDDWTPTDRPVRLPVTTTRAARALDTAAAAWRADSAVSDDAPMTEGQGR